MSDFVLLSEIPKEQNFKPISRWLWYDQEHFEFFLTWNNLVLMIYTTIINFKNSISNYHCTLTQMWSQEFQWIFLFILGYYIHFIIKYTVLSKVRDAWWIFMSASHCWPVVLRTPGDSSSFCPKEGFFRGPCSRCFGSGGRHYLHGVLNTCDCLTNGSFDWGNYPQDDSSNSEHQT